MTVLDKLLYFVNIKQAFYFIRLVYLICRQTKTTNSTKFLTSLYFILCRHKITVQGKIPALNSNYH